MGKTNYTQAFERFWSAYPRKTAKGPAFSAWQKKVDEDDAFMVDAIVNDLEKRTRLKWWPFDKTKIPHAATWINQERYLDEGWEDDIKTRGKETPAEPTPRPTFTPEPGHNNGPWWSMLNRIWRDYIIACRGLPENLAKQLRVIQRETFDELMPAIEEELAMAEDEKVTRKEMQLMLGTTLLSRFDNVTGRELKPMFLARR